MAERVAGTAGRAIQVRSQPAHQWTDDKRNAFLAALAEICNVKASCAAVGMSTTTAYALRLRDDGFAAQWRAAILTGYERLEEALLQAAGAALAAAPGEAGEGQAFDPQLAMRLLERHRSTVEGRSNRRAGPVTRASREEAEAALHARLDALERKRRLRK
jgi:hypothetical protein